MMGGKTIDKLKEKKLREKEKGGITNNGAIPKRKEGVSSVFKKD